MTLFQMLTRVGIGKARITRKLIEKMRREVRSQKRRIETPRRRPGGGAFIQPRLALLIACLMIPVCQIPAATVAGAATTGDGLSSDAGYSAAALYNQGNEAARKGRIGEAVVSYERARLLAPGDPDIETNLKLVREHAGIAAATEGRWNSLFNWASPNTFAWIGCAGLLMAGTGLLMFRRRLHGRPASWVALGIGGLLVLLTIGNAVVVAPQMNLAVVVAEQAGARVSPAATADERFVLREGETIRVRGGHGGFVLVSNAAGESGWLTADAMERLVP